MASRLIEWFWTYFSKPAADRQVYKKIRKQRISRIVELGIGDGKRAQRMIALAARGRPVAEIEYTGIDLFEGRPAGAPKVSLKDMHVRLRATGAAVRLVPGDPYSALARKANELSGQDLIVISQEVDLTALERAWFYVPRMLKADSQIYILQSANNKEGIAGRWLSRKEIDALAAAAAPATRRAA